MVIVTELCSAQRDFMIKIMDVYVQVYIRVKIRDLKNKCFGMFLLVRVR